MAKKYRSGRSVAGVVAVAVVVAFIGCATGRRSSTRCPKGIASGNGRIESKLVDVAAKEPLRVKEVLVDEGDLVKPGQVWCSMDTVTLEAELAEAKASVAAAQEQLAVAKAAIVKQQSEIELAEDREGRARGKLVDGARRLAARARRAHDEAGDDARPRSPRQTGEAADRASKQVEVAQANVATVAERITDATLTSPVLGRVLYRLAEPGEVLARRRQGADAGQPRRRLHGDLPAVRAGGRGARSARRRASPSTTSPKRVGRRLRQLRVARGAVHARRRSRPRASARS